MSLGHKMVKKPSPKKSSRSRALPTRNGLPSIFLSKLILGTHHKEDIWKPFLLKHVIEGMNWKKTTNQITCLWSDLHMIANLHMIAETNFGIDIAYCFIVMPVHEDKTSVIRKHPRKMLLMLLTTYSVFLASVRLQSTLWTIWLCNFHGLLLRGVHFSLGCKSSPLEKRFYVHDIFQNAHLTSVRKRIKQVHIYQEGQFKTKQNTQIKTPRNEQWQVLTYLD